MTAAAVRERLFGTDGARGRFGEPPLDHRTVTELGRQVARWLAERAGTDTADGAARADIGAGAGTAGAPRGSGGRQVVLGGDTRESTPELCAWLAAGLAAEGAEVRYAGVVPTPGVSHLAAQLGAGAGVVVSASHNLYPDNGIKLLDAQGRKWSERDEAEIEERLLAALGGPVGGAGAAAATATGAAAAVAGAAAARAGAASEPAVEPELRQLYLRHLAGTVEGGSLAGLRVVVDAGNGAASRYARELFEGLGAEVVRLLDAAPDGRNVNLHCGSTAPERMAAETAAAGADLGIAYDGDADRCILADERGEVRDGDAILYLWAIHLHEQGHLRPPRIVATSMSNLGLERALARHGIEVVRCDVGDRAVVETMRRDGVLLGGEQSGHVVCLDLAATGDGLLTSLQIAALRRQAGRPLSELLAGFRRYPQVLLNVRVRHKPDLGSLPAVAAAAREVERTLGADGRLVLRYSGTEPLARVMIEGPEQAFIDDLAAHLAGTITSELG